MTDNEIIKALECCNIGEDYRVCDICPCCIEGEKAVDCVQRLHQNTLDLINRQKAEIERLCIEIDELIIAKDLLFDEAEALIRKAKVEAIKEFAEDVCGEIDDAIHSNYNAKEERETNYKKQGISFDSDDSFLMYCDGKIYALSGIASYIDNLVKEMVGDNNANNL